MPSDSERDKETALWGWLRRGKDQLPAGAHLQRIENAVASGTPDVEGCIDGRAFWVELKVAYKRLEDKALVKITDKQVHFALRRCRAGGRSWVLVRLTHLKENYLIPGTEAEHMLNKPVSVDWLRNTSRTPPSASAVEVLRSL